MKKNRIRNVVIALVMSILLLPVEPIFAQESSKTYAELFEAVMQRIEQDYTGNISRKELFEAAMKGMFQSLDEYSDFFTKEEVENFEKNINKNFEGIGVQFRKEKDKFVITKIIPGGSAGEAGIRAGDILLEADGFALSQLETTNDVADKILGKKGTKVRIKIQRGKDTLDFHLERRKLHLPTAEQIDWKDSKIALPDGVKPEEVLFISLSSFGEETAQEFTKILKKPANQKAKILLLDLRDNGGGYVSSVLEIANQILPKGKIVSFVGNDGKSDTYYSELSKSSFQKIVALVDKNSASASEILAGAIKDSGIGYIIGENTFGKGVAQEVLSLQKGGYSFKLTYKEFFTPKGTPIQKAGIEPDVEIKIPNLIISEHRFFLGDVSNTILDIENVLHYLGYLQEKPDTKYEAPTAKAILEFQKANSLGMHNVIDFTTQATLNKALQDSVIQQDRILIRAVEEIGKILLTGEK